MERKILVGKTASGGKNDRRPFEMLTPLNASREKILHKNHAAHAIFEPEPPKDIPWDKILTTIVSTTRFEGTIQRIATT